MEMMTGGQCLPHSVPEIPLTSTSNSFAALTADLVNDAEREVIAVLEGWATVKHGRGAAKRKAKKVQHEWILAIEAKRKLVEKELEDLDDDEELVLVDSGCGNHACHPEKHFKKFRMRPSAGSRAGRVLQQPPKSPL